MLLLLIGLPALFLAFMAIAACVAGGREDDLFDAAFGEGRDRP